MRITHFRLNLNRPQVLSHRLFIILLIGIRRPKIIVNRTLIGVYPSSFLILLNSCIILLFPEVRIPQIYQGSRHIGLNSQRLFVRSNFIVNQTQFVITDTQAVMCLGKIPFNLQSFFIFRYCLFIIAHLAIDIA
ncbi:hypothetical protein ES703_115317 [subsurface metagenome]